MHFGEGDDEGEFLVVDVEFEQSPSADDLQGRQDDAADVDVRDEDVAGDFADVLQKSQVQVLVLEPSQFQVAVDVRAVGVAVAQIPVVVLPVGRHRHPPVRPDANWTKINYTN